MGTPKLTPFQNIEIGKFLYGKNKEPHHTSQILHGYFGEFATFMLQKGQELTESWPKILGDPLGHCVRK